MEEHQFAAGFGLQGQQGLQGLQGAQDQLGLQGPRGMRVQTPKRPLDACSSQQQSSFKGNSDASNKDYCPFTSENDITNEEAAAAVREIENLLYGSKEESSSTSSFDAQINEVIESKCGGGVNYLKDEVKPMQIEAQMEAKKSQVETIIEEDVELEKLIEVYMETRKSQVETMSEEDLELEKHIWGYKALMVLIKENKQQSLKEAHAETKKGKKASQFKDLPIYKPPLPFPQRTLTKAQEAVHSKFRKDMEEAGATLPQVETLFQVKDHVSFIRDLSANREKVEHLMHSFSGPSKTNDEPKSLTKLGNQGKFEISCMLGELKVEEVLCDLGSSVNLMSLDVARTLGINKLKPYQSTINFVDASSRQPIGVIEDYPLKIGNCMIPTDFIVMEMVKSKEPPLLLGTPFLNTAGAEIDFFKKRARLKMVNDGVSFPLKPPTSSFCNTIAPEGEEISEKPPERKEQLMGFTVAALKEEDPLDHNEYDGIGFDGESLLAMFDGVCVEANDEPPRQKKRVRKQKKKIYKGANNLLVKKGEGTSVPLHPLP